MGEIDRTIERLEAATADARQVLRELHEATQGMRDATREAAAVRTRALEDVVGTIKAEVAEQVQRLAEQTDRAITDATTATFDRFDRLGDLLLNGKGAEHLERLALNWRRRAEHAREQDREPVPEVFRRQRR